MSARVYKSEGRSYGVRPKNGTDFTLEELQDVVGGHIEVVWLSRNRFMVVNEEGKNLNLPVNTEATKIVNTESVPRLSDIIVGDVLVCDRRMIH